MLVGRWWNGRYGWGRRDIWLFVEGGAWRVDAREGRDDAKTWRRDYVNEADARAEVDAMFQRTSGRDKWIDITAAVLGQRR